MELHDSSSGVLLSCDEILLSQLLPASPILSDHSRGLRPIFCLFSSTVISEGTMRYDMVAAAAGGDGGGRRRRVPCPRGT